MTFSEESRLLVGNWDAYQDVLKADKKLRSEMQQALMSLESRLRKADFWNKGWHCHANGNAQFYVWHDNWLDKGGPLVWVGVEGASVEGVFGDDTPASAYVWVSRGEAVALVEDLRKLFRETGTGTHGDVVSGKGCYAVRQVLPKCLPEHLARFDAVFLDEAEAFIDHYARCEGAITKAVQEHMKGARRK